MGAPKDPITGLTVQQDAFAHAVASGLNQSDAYRLAYNVALDTLSSSVAEVGSRLGADVNIIARIAAIKAAAEAATIQQIAWNRAKLVREADRHRELALSGGWRGVSAANGALEVIGRAMGLLADNVPEFQQPITRVVIVLDHGQGRVTQETRIVEAAPPAALEAKAEEQIEEE